MKRGDKVYSVQPGLNPGTDYIVQERTLVVVSAKQLRLDDYFQGGSNLIFKPDALGTYFHATPAKAVKAFVDSMTAVAEAARAKTRIAETRAQHAFMFSVAWAESGEPVLREEPDFKVDKGDA